MPQEQPSSLIDFPAGGLDESRAYVRQKKYAGEGETVYTTPDALNVRAFDYKSRRRGGSRPGLRRLLDGGINIPTNQDPHSIQDLNQLVRGNTNPTRIFAPFVFAFTGSGGGYGLGSTQGVEYFSSGSGNFYCSCWDVKGNAYITEAIVGKDKSFTGVERVNSYGDGLLIWSNEETDQAVQGMVVIGDYLYVAVATGIFAATHAIWKFHTEDGKPWSGVDPVWLDQTKTANLFFSTGSHNCLAAVDRFLGVIVCGDGAAQTDNFVVIDTASATPEVPFASTGSFGTGVGNAACKADSDGKFFYAAMPSGNGKIAQITPEGTVVWTFTCPTINNTIAYDARAHRLFVLCPDNGEMRTVNASSGLQMALVSPGGTNIWDEIDCDWAGNLILWANGQATGDVYAVNPRLEKIWGPNTLAQGAAVDHRGASVFRSDGRSSQPGRVVYLAVAGGRLSRYTIDSFDMQGRRTLGEATPVITPRRWNETADRVFSWQNGPHMYYVDGVDYARYNGFTDTAELWRPLVTAGEMPFDNQGRAARLIATWRGRTVLAGFPDDVQNWFMSRIDDPLDWDYFASEDDAARAVFSDAVPLIGLMGDAINTIIPYNDDILVFGCDHTIVVLSGDPLDGGTKDVVSDTIGMCWGRPWCRDPDGTLYFVGSRSQVYAWKPGTKTIVWISQQIERRMKRVDVGMFSTAIRLGWNDAEKGIEMYITSYDHTRNNEHWFWDSRAGAWWPVELAHVKMQPKAILEADADQPDDRIIHVGSWDSHVRAMDDFASGEDDGFPYRSHVAFGPFLSDGLGEVSLAELQMVLAADSDGVAYEVMAARTAEQALPSPPVVRGVWDKGRATTAPINRSAHGLYLRVRSPVPGRVRGVWSMEAIRAKLKDTGMVRRRS